jgi:hypothetical protein
MFIFNTTITAESTAQNNNFGQFSVATANHNFNTGEKVFG